VGKTEVTQAQWEAVMRTRPWDGKRSAPTAGDHPVTYVSFHDAERFCRELSRASGKAVRLPREIEWEYACRAGSSFAYCYGDPNEQLGEYGWYQKNAFLAGEAHPHPVARKKPNAWGLHDVHGNVWEWCYDQRDDNGPRSIRGGSWVSEARYCRSGFRGAFPRDKSNYDVGFRIVVEAE